MILSDVGIVLKGNLVLSQCSPILQGAQKSPRYVASPLVSCVCVQSEAISVGKHIGFIIHTFYFDSLSHSGTPHKHSKNASNESGKEVL